jgi:tetratricopeptide (TPR) repeat protein
MKLQRMLCSMQGASTQDAGSAVSDMGGALMIDDILDILDRSALAVVLALDELSEGGSYDQTELRPSDRWYGLLDRQLGGHDPAGALACDEAKRLLVTAAAFLTVEARELENRGAVDSGSRGAEHAASAVAGRAYAAARSLLGLVEGDRALPRTQPETRRVETAEFSTTGVSGLSGVDQIPDVVLTKQVEPPIDHLPDVRGRESTVAELLGFLDEPDECIHVLTGRAGSGKSTIALEVARQALLRDLDVWWIGAADGNQLVRGVLAVATQLGATVDERSAIQQWAPDRGIDRLWERLDAAPRPWLLVVDNVDDPTILGVAGGTDGCSAWIRPSAGGTVLLTTRVEHWEDWGDRAVVHGVADLEPDDGAEVLLDRMGLTGRQRSAMAGAARELSCLLGGVPLALCGAGGYLGSPVARHTATELAVHLAGTPRNQVGMDPHLRVGPTWRLSLDALAEGGSSCAWRLLGVLAYYAPERTVADDVLAGEQLVQCGLTPTSETTPAEWKSALDGLVAVGLVDRTVTVGQKVHGVTVHPLVAEVVLDEVPGSLARERLESAAVRLLRQAADQRDPGQPADWADLHRLEPHVTSLIDRMLTQEWRTRADVLGLANQVARSLVRAGLFVLAEKLVRHAQRHTRRFLPPADPTFLASEHILAWALGLRGEIVEAEDRFRHLLEERLAVSGPTDPSTLAVRDSLAWMLAERGRLAEARHLLCELLPDQQRRLGSRHQATMGTRHRLAWIEALLGHHEIAEINLGSVLRERMAVLGKQHMDVFGTRYRLAWVVALRGRAQEAEDMYRLLAADLENVLGADHPTTLMARSRAAWALSRRGKLVQAAAEYRELITTRELVLGPSHPRTVKARHDLACVLTRQGAHDEAERLFQGVLTARTQALGADHVRTVATRLQAALLLAERGELAAAEHRLRRLVRHGEVQGRMDHPNILTARYLLGTTLLKRGRLDKAEQELLSLLGDQQRTVGPLYRTSLATRDTLAMLLGARGLLDECELQVRHVLDDRMSVLGHLDLDTLTSRDHLGWVLAEQGRLAEAKAIFQVLAADRARLLEPTHPDVLDTRYRLAWLMNLAAHHDEAATAYRALLADQTQALGPAHPRTLRTQGGLVRAVLLGGRPEQAAELAANLFIVQDRVLGGKHPDTVHTRVSQVLAEAVAGRPERAEAALVELITEQETFLGPEHPACLINREHVGWVLQLQGRSTEAQQHWLKLEQVSTTVLGVGHPQTMRLRRRLTKQWSSPQPPLLS